MMISTRPLPGHLHTSASFLQFKVACVSTHRQEIPTTLNDFPLRVRYYTEKVVFWKERPGELYMFKLSPVEVGRVKWEEREDGVIVDLSNSFAPVEVEPVSELELLFLFS